MREEFWSSLKKGRSIIDVEYGNDHYATLFAEDIQVKEGPPFSIRLDLDRSLRTRATSSGPYLDAVELANGEIRQLKVVQLDDSYVVERLEETLQHVEEVETLWYLLVSLRGRHEFMVQPEYRENGGHKSFLLHVIQQVNGDPEA